MLAREAPAVSRIFRTRFEVRLLHTGDCTETGEAGSVKRASRAADLCLKLERSYSMHRQGMVMLDPLGELHMDPPFMMLTIVDVEPLVRLWRSFGKDSGTLLHSPSRVVHKRERVDWMGRRDLARSQSLRS